MLIVGCQKDYFQSSTKSQLDSYLGDNKILKSLNLKIIKDKNLRNDLVKNELKINWGEGRFTGRIGDTTSSINVPLQNSEGRIVSYLHANIVNGSLYSDVVTVERIDKKPIPNSIAENEHHTNLLSLSQGNLSAKLEIDTSKIRKKISLYQSKVDPKGLLDAQIQNAQVEMCHTFLSITYNHAACTSQDINNMFMSHFNYLISELGGHAFATLTGSGVSVYSTTNVASALQDIIQQTFIYLGYASCPAEIQSIQMVNFCSETPFDGNLPGNENNGDVYEAQPGNGIGYDLEDEFECFSSISNNNANYKVTMHVHLPNPSNPQMVVYGANAGHVYLELSKENGSMSQKKSFGFYPESSIKSISHLPVNSVILDEYLQPGRYSQISYEMVVSASEFNIVQQASILYSQQQYDLNNYNCADYAIDVMNSIRQSSPFNVPNSYTLSTTPSGTYNYLYSLREWGDTNVLLAHRTPYSSKCD